MKPLDLARALKARLAEWRAAEKAATAGPWRVARRRPADKEHHITNVGSYTVATIDVDDPPFQEHKVLANEELIASTRTLWPAALGYFEARVEQLIALLTNLDSHTQSNRITSAVIRDSIIAEIHQIAAALAPELVERAK